MPRSLVACLLCCLPGLAVTIPLGPDDWHATPAWTGTSAAAEYAFSSADGVARFEAAGGGRTMIWARHYVPPLDITGLTYLTLRYRAEQINPELSSYFLFLGEGDDGRMTSDRLAVSAADLITDGEWHVLTTQLKIRDQLVTAAIRFEALEGRTGVVELSHFELTADPARFPLSEALAIGEAQAVPGAVDIPVPTTSLAVMQEKMAVADWFAGERVTVEGAAFQVPTTDPVAASTDFKTKGDLSLPLAGRQGRELRLLAGAELSYRLLGYNGWEPGDRIRQPQRLGVRVVYADGTEESQVPYALDYQAFGFWRGIHPYAVALEPKPLARVELRDGMVFGALHLIAATLSDEVLRPADPGPATPPTPPRVEPVPAAVRMDGTTATIAAGAGTIQLQLGETFTLAGLTSIVPGWSLTAEPAALFKLVEGGQTITGADFAIDQVQADEQRVVATGTCAASGLEARLTAWPTGSEARLELALRSTRPEPRRLTVTLPDLAVAHARSDDLRYAIPRSGLIVSDVRRVFRSEYGGMYPVQWLDLHDAVGGVTVATRTTEPWPRTFIGGKSTEGVGQAAVEFLDNRVLAPGEWQAWPTVAITLHAGDWHAAFDADRDWRATWNQPPAPRPDWFQKIWHLRTHWVRTLGNGNPEYNWLDPATGKLRAAEFVAKDRAAYGDIDYIHLFDWRISDEYGRWGDYSHYNAVGGLPAFKAAIEQVQAEGIRVGLYLDTYLVSRKSLLGQSPEAAAWQSHYANGKPKDGYSTPDDPMMNMCASQPGWQDYLAETCRRVAAETGCDGIYLDEGGFTTPVYDCYREDHGHPVPATTLEGERYLFEKVRAALPPEVALYTEYCPPDITAPYLSGAYMHWVKYTDPDLSPGWLNLSRFAFPDLKLFPITNGGSSIDGIYDGFKLALFNGTAIYSLAWGHDQETFALLRKMDEILEAHEAAFGDPAPTPLVPTAHRAVVANRFVGGGETVYTLWNDSYRTLTAPVLRLPHRDGARYVDVWNGTPLTPRIEEGQAVIELTLPPRDIGIVAQVVGPTG